MGNFLEYIVKIAYHLIFFSLLGTSLYLIVQYNNSQKEIFINSTNILASQINNRVDKFENYFYLEKVNKELQDQNALLLQKIFEYGINNSNIPAYPNDSANFELITVKVCNSNFNLRNNNLTLCQGENDGLQKDLGVITENGIIGIIRDISPNRARVMSILHSQSIIDCSLKKAGAHGSLVWNGKNPKILDLIDIPKHINIAIGDTVETSGFSTIFPKGLLVGKVVDVQLPKGSNIFDISVEIFNDPAAVKHGYVIKNRMTKEQKELEGKDE
jgi:rod shape-determining protein MreC